MLVVLGRVLGAHGIRGTLKCAYETDRPETLERYPYFLAVDWETGEFSALTPESISLREKNFLLKAAEMPDRNHAERLFFRTLEAPGFRVPPRPDGEYFSWQLEGLSVVREDGESLGTVLEVMFLPAGAVLEISGGTGEFSVPFKGQGVLEVNLEKGVIVVSKSVGAGTQ